MRKLLISVYCVLAVMLGTSAISYSQVVVKIKPAPPVKVVERPRPPRPNYYWIEPRWRWNARVKQYDWVEGEWVKPRPRYVYAPGHWADRADGFIWVEGHWKLR